MVLELSWDARLVLIGFTSLSFTVIASEIVGSSEVRRAQFRRKHFAGVSRLFFLVNEVDISLVLHVIDTDSFFSLILQGAFNNLSHLWTDMAFNTLSNRHLPIFQFLQELLNGISFIKRLPM